LAPRRTGARRIRWRCAPACARRSDSADLRDAALQPFAFLGLALDDTRNPTARPDCLAVPRDRLPVEGAGRFAGPR
jgi:hypothetical protein